MSGGPRASELHVGGMFVFHTYVKEAIFKVSGKLKAAHQTFPQVILQSTLFKFILQNIRLLKEKGREGEKKRN